MGKFSKNDCREEGKGRKKEREERREKRKKERREKKKGRKEGKKEGGKEGGKKGRKEKKGRKKEEKGRKKEEKGRKGEEKGRGKGRGKKVQTKKKCIKRGTQCKSTTIANNRTISRAKEPNWRHSERDARGKFKAVFPPKTQWPSTSDCPSILQGPSVGYLDNLHRNVLNPILKAVKDFGGQISRFAFQMEKTLWNDLKTKTDFEIEEKERKKEAEEEEDLFIYLLGFKVVFHCKGDIATVEVGGQGQIKATCRMILVYNFTT